MDNYFPPEPRSRTTVDVRCNTFTHYVAPVSEGIHNLTDACGGDETSSGNTILIVYFVAVVAGVVLVLGIIYISKRFVEP